MCFGHLDGQQPDLGEVLRDCAHSKELRDLKATGPQASPSGPQDTGANVVQHPAPLACEAKAPESSEEDLLFGSSKVACEGPCSSGLMYLSVRAALQQSFQLLLAKG